MPCQNKLKSEPWNASYTQDVGFLDVVGNDRKCENIIFCCLYLFIHFRQAWISLGTMSKEKAMEEYVKLLLDRCPNFRIHLHTQHDKKDRLR